MMQSDFQFLDVGAVIVKLFSDKLALPLVHEILVGSIELVQHSQSLIQKISVMFPMFWGVVVVIVFGYKY